MDYIDAILDAVVVLHACQCNETEVDSTCTAAKKRLHMDERRKPEKEKRKQKCNHFKVYINGIFGNERNACYYFRTDELRKGHADVEPEAMSQE